MNRTSIRRAIVPTVAALTLGLGLAACGGGNDTGTADAADGGDTSAYDGLSGELTGGGASSQESAQNAWIVGFGDVAPDVTVTYDPQGSGAGRENFISGGYAFAGTDAYLTDDEGELTKATETCGGSDPIEIPNYVSPIAVIYNLDGVDDLKLAPDTLAKIFAGDITTWDDPAIAADNPDATLPSENINTVHRSDESGTSENFTDYLDDVAADSWTYGPVETWPKEAGGEGAKGTDGVVAAVTSGANSIGYADASKAAELGQAEIKVGTDYVGPSAEAAAKILEVSPEAAEAGDNALIFDLDHSTDEADTYPIVLTSYLLACQTYSDEETAKLVKGYATYILSDEGQDIGSTEAGSAPLPDDIRAQAQKLVEKIGS